MSRKSMLRNIILIVLIILNIALLLGLVLHFSFSGKAVNHVSYAFVWILLIFLTQMILKRVGRQ